MEVETGWLEMQSDGCLTGVLRTLTLNVQMELRPLNREKPDEAYEVRVGGGWAMGEAKRDPLAQVIEIVIRSPELHRPIHLSAREQTGRNEWRMIWTPPMTS